MIHLLLLLLVAQVHREGGAGHSWTRGEGTAPDPLQRVRAVHPPQAPG